MSSSNRCRVGVPAAVQPVLSPVDIPLVQVASCAASQFLYRATVRRPEVRARLHHGPAHEPFLGTVEVVHRGVGGCLDGLRQPRHLSRDLHRHAPPSATVSGNSPASLRVYSCIASMASGWLAFARAMYSSYSSRKFASVDSTGFAAKSPSAHSTTPFICRGTESNSIRSCSVPWPRSIRS